MANYINDAIAVGTVNKINEAVAADDAIDEADYAEADIAEANEVNEAICNSETIATAMKLKSDATTNCDIAKGRD
jgi:hypothetical protein